MKKGWKSMSFGMTVLLAWLFLGFLASLLIAYNPYTSSFEPGFFDGTSLQLVFAAYLMIFIASPFFFYQSLFTLIEDYKSGRVQEWRTKKYTKR
jgi:hypothetical protein